MPVPIIGPTRYFSYSAAAALLTAPPSRSVVRGMASAASLIDQIENSNQRKTRTLLPWYCRTTAYPRLLRNFYIFDLQQGVAVMTILDPMLYDFQPQVKTPDPKFFELHVEVSPRHLQQDPRGALPTHNKRIGCSGAQNPLIANFVPASGIFTWGLDPQTPACLGFEIQNNRTAGDKEKKVANLRQCNPLASATKRGNGKDTACHNTFHRLRRTTRRTSTHNKIMERRGGALAPADSPQLITSTPTGTVARPTASENDDIARLEEEAMATMRKYSRDWFFFDRKLKAASDELGAAREDRDLFPSDIESDLPRGIPATVLVHDVGDVCASTTKDGSQLKYSEDDKRKEYKRIEDEIARLPKFSGIWFSLK
ncbi:hypothetical protein THAOC_02090 [Thalassiosira oceanica]|uniref:Uncharacterized protein n=1 Tax=Thalassiosira oceanica TaxID=159749 RepID=K0TBW3_THAOC|nr:hypothetical protein THAOC_02090 [Thalassiosira oceanica]|eukprot:EJK76168.1 hypothetical protein THAOC_02090 [Thalassiosira oceanica]